MAITKTIYNISCAYSLNGTTIPINITSASITDVTNIDVAFNRDGYGQGLDDINGREKPDICVLVMNSMPVSLTSLVSNQIDAILQGATADERLGTLTLSCKKDPNDKFILDYARPSGATSTPNITESSADTGTIEFRGRIVSNFKGNVE